MIMAKVCYILHGLGASPSDNWFPWLKQQLNSKGYRVIVPEFPNTFLPKITEWLAVLKKTVEENGEGVIIGHSLGGVLAIRYLLAGGLASQVILVAAPFEKLELLSDVDEFMIDFSPIRKLREKSLKDIQFIVFQSNNDYRVPVSHGKKWTQLLGAEYRLLPGYGHFLEKDFPEILEYF